MDLPPVPLWRVKSPPYEKAQFQDMENFMQKNTLEWNWVQAKGRTNLPESASIQLQNLPGVPDCLTHPPTH